MRASPFVVLVLAACTTDPGQPTFLAALNATVSDPEVLSKACGRDVPPMEAHAASFQTTFEGFRSSRSVLGADGTGSVTFTYAAPSGAPCTADLSFSFHQETTMRRFARRNVAYDSTVELTDVGVAPRS